MGLLCTHRDILTMNLMPTLAYVKYFLTKSEKYPAMLPDTSTSHEPKGSEIIRYLLVSL